jgi:hypothetical protein
MDQNNKNNIDLSQEFEATQTQPNSQPVFESEPKPKSKMTQSILKYSGGIIKSEKQANLLMLVYVVIAIIATFVILYTGGVFKGSPKTTPLPKGQEVPMPR